MSLRPTTVNSSRRRLASVQQNTRLRSPLRVQVNRFAEFACTKSLLAGRAEPLLPQKTFTEGAVSSDSL